MPLLEPLLHQALDECAVELRITTGSPPMLIAADNHARAVTDTPWSAEQLGAELDSLLDDARRATLEREGRLSLTLKVGDYRFVAKITRDGQELVFRARPQAIPAHFRGSRGRHFGRSLLRVELGVEDLAGLATDGIKHRLDRLLEGMEKHDASDLHLRRNRRPCYRIAGQILELEQIEPLDDAALGRTIYAALNAHQVEVLERELSLDFTRRTPNGARFRINVFHEAGSLGLAARRVSTSVPSFETLHLPPSILQITEMLEGLVLVCGATGSGKSTTLAAAIEVINHRDRCTIMTLEDPIEYAYSSKRALIAQREVGIDCLDWVQGMKHVLRQDPDVILIGEMRDAASFEIALQASETGHLVFSTLHASNAAQVPGRILDLFPAGQHGVVRQGLAANLRAVVCQRLLPARGGGVVPAVEFLLVSPAVQKLIREGRDHVIEDLILADDEMLSFNESLHALIVSGQISLAVGLENSTKPERLQMMLRGIHLNDERRGGMLSR